MRTRLYSEFPAKQGKSREFWRFDVSLKAGKWLFP